MVLPIYLQQYIINIFMNIGNIDTLYKLNWVLRCFVWVSNFQNNYLYGFINKCNHRWYLKNATAPKSLINACFSVQEHLPLICLLTKKRLTISSVSYKNSRLMIDHQRDYPHEIAKSHKIPHW